MAPHFLIGILKEIPLCQSQMRRLIPLGRQEDQDRALSERVSVVIPCNSLKGYGRILNGTHQMPTWSIVELSGTTP